MLMTIDRLREMVPSASNMSDEEVRARLESLESLVRKYTNNNFQKRNIRTLGTIIDGELILGYPYIKFGDTVEISKSRYNDGLCVIGEETALIDEDEVLVTKVEYPSDIVVGVANMFKWDIENRGKVGIQSESLSRYSVTYFNMDGDNSIMGYPKSILGFLKPYMRARF